MLRTTVLKAYACPGCGFEATKAINHTGHRAPKPGSYSICSKCAAINVWTAAMQLRPADPIERVNLYAGRLGPLACELIDKIRYPKKKGST